MKNKLTAKMDRHIGLSLLLTLALTFLGCSSGNDDNNNNNPNGGGDIEEVAIGSQVWMKKNLDVAVDGSKCYGEDGQVLVSGSADSDNGTYVTLTTAEVQANCTKYGRLYDWATAMALPSSCNTTTCSPQEPHQGICPSGWHIPSNKEWNTLINFAGGEDVAGKKLKATDGWIINGNGTNGTDEFGFAAMPGGAAISDGSNRIFSAVDKTGYWRTSTESSETLACVRFIAHNIDATKDSDDTKDIDDRGCTNKVSRKPYLESVRCIKD